MSAENRKSKINVLDKHLAELIAAGEVVERPASVVKELVENAIDAGAKNISVILRGGGISLIQITDDGGGIEHEDVPLAFLRHATSKIASEDDLYGILTLGFRGEALASVAAVARVNLFTKTRDEDFGTHYHIEGGEELEYEEAGCADGTTIIVEDLFFNTPARMKFLKKDSSEASAAAGVVEKIALSHPEISFRLTRDGKEILHTPGDGDLKSAVYAVLGREFAATLIPVDYALGGVKVTGFITKPTFSRGSRGMQYFYINGRYIKSGTIMTALENGYKNSIMVGKFPGAVLNVELAPQLVDVNVHPSKMEVKFSDDRPIFSAVYNAVKTALSLNDTSSVMKLYGEPQSRADAREPDSSGTDASASAASRLTYPAPADETADTFNSGMVEFIADDREEIFQAGVFKQNESSDVSNASRIGYNMSYAGKGSRRPFSHSGKSIDIFADDEPSKGDDKEANAQSGTKDADYYLDEAEPSEDEFGGELFLQDSKPGTEGSRSSCAAQTEEPVLYTSDKAAEPKFLGEAFSTYIIVEYGDNIVFVDKHASHERIIFERLKSSMSTAPQLLLSPVVIALGSDEYDALLQNLDTVCKAGFEIEDAGRSSVAVKAVPPFLNEKDIEGVVTEMAGKFKYGSMAASEKTDWIYHTISCKAAIRAGDTSSERELMELVKKVVVEKSIKFCPHGRPTAFILTRKELEKQFRRIV